MSPELLFMAGFVALIVVILGIDLGVVNRRNHVVPIKEALVWTGVWIGTALLFCLFIRFKAEWIHGVASFDDLLRLNELYGHGLALDAGAGFEANLEMYRKAMSLEYLTGYFIEKALSVDNLFVMIMIFLSFRTNPKYYHEVLFYGIIGAVLMRFGFIFLASALIQRFAWILWVFGGMLIFSGAKMFFDRHDDKERDMKKHPVVKFVSKYLRLTDDDRGGRFFVRFRGHFYMTPLFLVLIIIECSDVIFAVDSIPAIFSVTLDPYIVFFSNIFAILGLRSLFFVLSGMMDKFAYLKTGLAVLLTFIGAKMLLHGIFHITIGTGASLFVILGILAVSIAASLAFPPRKKSKAGA